MTVSSKKTMKNHAPALPAPKGFTLIEVTMALGIISFALVALLGMLGIGLSSIRSSATEATVALISSNVASELQSGTWKTKSDAITLYFSHSGVEMTSASDDGFKAVATPLLLDSTPNVKSWKLEVFTNTGQQQSLFTSRLSASL
jgi:uncharacterized protein (TIGR02598 family)